MKLLIHTCCAHCLGKTVNSFRTELSLQTDPSVYWYNPNIHPLIEYRRRLKAVRLYLERDRLPFIIDDEYGLLEFCRVTADKQLPPIRCAECYRIRLERTAMTARDKGFSHFTTTLITSRHQSHELICEAGNKAAEKYGVEFIYRDLRKAEADEKLIKGLYHQQYCGCVFSEYERYKDTSKHIYKGM